jgi:hypothetical protein
MISMTVRNRARSQYLTGYGRINAGLLQHVTPNIDDLDAEVHIFASPPYSFHTMIEPRFNVGLTYCDRPVHKYPTIHGSNFVDKCNAMDLILTSGEVDRQAFIDGGVTTKILVSPPGFDHMSWLQPVRRQENQKVFVMARGRDISAQVDIAREYFEVEVVSGNTAGNMPDEELKAKYRDADIFLKWADEYTWSYPVLEAMAAGCLVIANSPYVFLTNENSLRFRDEAELRSILQSCKAHDHIDKKVKAREDVYRLNWEQAAARIMENIYSAYRSEHPLNP